MEKVRPWCGQPSDRERLKNRTEQLSERPTFRWVGGKLAWAPKPRIVDEAVGVLIASLTLNNTYEFGENYVTEVTLLSTRFAR